MLFKQGVVILLFIILNTYSALAELPYTFQAGQQAKASEVNENFAYVNKTNYVLKANGVLVGDVLSINYDYAYVVNEKSFRVPVSTNGAITRDEKIHRIYTEQNCSGTPYVNTPIMDTVFPDGFSLYYVLNSQTPTTITLKSSTNPDTGACINADIPFQTPAIKATANDPTITGVQNICFGCPIPYRTPITIEVR